MQCVKKSAPRVASLPIFFTPIPYDCMAPCTQSCFVLTCSTPPDIVRSSAPLHALASTQARGNFRKYISTTPVPSEMPFTAAFRSASPEDNAVLD